MASVTAGVWMPDPEAANGANGLTSPLSDLYAVMLTENCTEAVAEASEASNMHADSQRGLQDAGRMSRRHTPHVTTYYVICGDWGERDIDFEAYY
ncbi:hypothetical protein FHL15_009359 [Xylaria flabelliformis]|uniref:Uncharacterized protein n=1 Tax=Xylaria flabelliformis TaxID=2512241 RepID=A0A553HPC5_9PEZI|nr:hypothetical protein FHL15_009359 [Xylaria flabelliformis]